jgi:hypothetical protein
MPVRLTRCLPRGAVAFAGVWPGLKSLFDFVPISQEKWARSSSRVMIYMSGLSPRQVSEYESTEYLPYLATISRYFD